MTGYGLVMVSAATGVGSATELGVRIITDFLGWEEKLC